MPNESAATKLMVVLSGETPHRTSYAQGGVGILRACELASMDLSVRP